VTDSFLSTDELAAFLGVAGKTVRKMRYERTGPPAHKIGAAVRYRLSDVERWLQTRRSA